MNMYLGIVLAFLSVLFSMSNSETPLFDIYEIKTFDPKSTTDLQEDLSPFESSDRKNSSDLPGDLSLFKSPDPKNPTQFKENLSTSKLFNMKSFFDMLEDRSPLEFSNSNITDIPEDLSPFAAQLYDLVNSSNIFHKLYNISMSPEEAQLGFMNAALALEERFNLPPSESDHQMLSFSVEDAFKSKISPMDYFRTFARTAETLLSNKGLLKEETRDELAHAYFEKLNDMVKSTESNIIHSLPSIYVLTTAIDDFFESVGANSPDDALFIMNLFGNEIKRNKN